MTIERAWQGRFTDYRSHGGRHLPFAAEAAWTVDGQEFPYRRGAMKTWTLGSRG